MGAPSAGLLDAFVQLLKQLSPARRLGNVIYRRIGLDQNAHRAPPANELEDALDLSRSPHHRQEQLVGPGPDGFFDFPRGIGGKSVNTTEDVRVRGSADDP